MITVRQLIKTFGQHTVLKDINFSVNAGETVTIIGPSGSGKSTLVRCLNGLEVPTSGQVTVSDITLDAAQYSKRDVQRLRRKTGMVFQSFNLFPHLNALRNVAQGLITVQGKSTSQAFEEAQQMLERVGLGDKLNHYPRQLSGGQQQRVAIARALALQPEVMLMDEPTSALDPELVQEVLQVIKEITKANVTSIIVTHELNFAREVSDRVMFMADAELIETAPPSLLFHSPQHPRTQAFMDTFFGKQDFVI